MSKDSEHIVIKATVIQTVVVCLTIIGAAVCTVVQVRDNWRDVNRKVDEAVPLVAQERWIAQTERINAGRTNSWIGADLRTIMKN